jgi:hypothetical protein
MMALSSQDLLCEKNTTVPLSIIQRKQLSLDKKSYYQQIKSKGKKMDYESEIAKLAAKADPLRKLDDDDERKDALGPIVDQINALRAAQGAARDHVLKVDVDSDLVREYEPESSAPKASTITLPKK